MLEPKEPECVGAIREIQPFLEEAIRQVRFTKSTNNIVEGPLSWRDFHRKASKTFKAAQQDDEGHFPEKVPNVIVATEKDAVLASPQLLHVWEKLSLGPYDQPKDVLYLAVVPDSNVVVEKTRIFLEELSKVYERHRFGKHVRVYSKEGVRDGIMRINHKSPDRNPDRVHEPELDRLFQMKFDADKKTVLSRLKSYVENVANDLFQFFKANDAIFERRMYIETLCRDSCRDPYTSLATSSDSSSMPPPAIPVQSPSSVLSSTSGPSSLGPLQQSPSASVTLAVAPGQPSPMNYQSMMGGLSNPLGTLPNSHGTEPLTPESQIGTPLSQDPAASLASNIEATIDQEVQKQLADESCASALPHVIVIYLV